jgi:uncharacterized protein with PIN domain
MCDEMLLRLGRWLRAAGYDTAIGEGGTDDGTLIASCAAESRVLLTRDRRLAARAEACIPVLRLVDDKIDDQARVLAAALGIDWQHAPFTRCVVDNAVLDPAPPEAAAEVPPRSRPAVSLQPTGLSRGGPLLCCPACGRLYWPGGHVRRMRERLAAWAR